MQNVHGKILKIDLSSRSTETVQLGEEIYQQYLGGRGLGSYLMYNYTRSGGDPLGADNPAIFLVGPVTGTPIPTAVKFCMVTKSPLTGGWLDSYSSGRLAVEMKMAGWDGIILTGKASSPCYIYVQDDRAEIRDAQHLWGKGAFETETKLLQETSEAGVLAIGPAAENGVKFACANSEYYRQLGRGGTGTVLASKNVKGLAVTGTEDIVCADPVSLLGMVSRYVYNSRNLPKALSHKKYGTAIVIEITNEAGMLPTRNFQKGIYSDLTGNLDGEAFLKTKVGTRGCYGCLLPCSQVTRAKSGNHVEGPEYETLCLLGSNLGIGDMDFVIEANYLCDDLGMDTMTAGGVIGFAMECFERGLLTRADTGGMNLKFGAKEEALQLLTDIAFKRGLGKVLAEGVRAAAEQIGGEAHKYAMHIKGMELPAYDPRAAFGAYLSYAVTPRGGCHRRCWPPKYEVLGNVPPFTWENKASLVRTLMNERIILHSMLICDFPATFLEITFDEYITMLGHVTGVSYALAEAQQIAERVETQIRLYNCREGFSRKDDTVPDRLFDESFDEGPNRGEKLSREDFEKMLSEYYTLRGWDEDGQPKPETLEKLRILGSA